MTNKKYYSKEFPTINYALEHFNLPANKHLQIVSYAFTRHFSVMVIFEPIHVEYKVVASPSDMARYFEIKYEMHAILHSGNASTYVKKYHDFVDEIDKLEVSILKQIKQLKTITNNQ